MQLGIALLLRDDGSDLSATVHAIELAKRTGGVVHAVFAEAVGHRDNRSKRRGVKEKDRSASVARIISLATWWSEKQDVKVHLHMLDRFTDEALLRLCSYYRIYCLVTGVDNCHSLRKESMRVIRLRRRLADVGTRHQPVLWSVIIRAWLDFAFEPVIHRFEKVVWQQDRDLLPADQLRTER